jgi:hypothetical protein
MDAYISAVLGFASVLFNNLEFFDAYYSIAPLHHLYLVQSYLRNASVEKEHNFDIRELFLFVLVSIWALRIFSVIFVRWEGFPH